MPVRAGALSSPASGQLAVFVRWVRRAGRGDVPAGASPRCTHASASCVRRSQVLQVCTEEPSRPVQPDRMNELIVSVRSHVPGSRGRQLRSAQTAKRPTGALACSRWPVRRPLPSPALGRRDRRASLWWELGTVVADAAGVFGLNVTDSSEWLLKQPVKGVEPDLHGMVCIRMVGGMNRRTPPSELAPDPETWPHAQLADTGGAAVQHLARRLVDVMRERGAEPAQGCGSRLA